METTEITSPVQKVRIFAATINAALDRCDNGEGFEFVSLDASLDHYALRCYGMSAEIRLWADGIFRGRTVLDPQVEEEWIKVGGEILERSEEMLDRARQAEIPCWDLPGANRLAAAVFSLRQMIDGWVTPAMSVAPAPRQSDGFQSQVHEAQRRIEALSPLPQDWLPADARQRSNYRKTGGS